MNAVKDLFHIQTDRNSYEESGGRLFKVSVCFSDIVCHSNALMTISLCVCRALGLKLVIFIEHKAPVKTNFSKDI